MSLDSEIKQTLDKLSLNTQKKTNSNSPSEPLDGLARVKTKLEQFSEINFTQNQSLPSRAGPVKEAGPDCNKTEFQFKQNDQIYSPLGPAQEPERVVKKNNHEKIRFNANEYLNFVIEQNEHCYPKFEIDWGRLDLTGYDDSTLRQGEVWSATEDLLLVERYAQNFVKFKKFSSLLAGIRLNEFSILCGSTGSGKTQFLANLVNDLAFQAVPTYVASIEVGSNDFQKRMLEAALKTDFTNRILTLDEKDIIEKQYKWFFNAPIFYHQDSGRTLVEKILVEIAYCVQKHNVKVAIVDNINYILNVVNDGNVLIEMDRVISMMVDFVKEIGVHLICVMHPRKTEGSIVKSGFDIKGSSTAVQEAHNVFLFNRLDEKQKKQQMETYPHLVDETTIHQFRALRIEKCRNYGLNVGKNIYLKSENGKTYDEF